MEPSPQTLPPTHSSTNNSGQQLSANTCRQVTWVSPEVGHAQTMSVGRARPSSIKSGPAWRPFKKKIKKNLFASPRYTLKHVETNRFPRNIIYCPHQSPLYTRSRDSHHLYLVILLLFFIAAFVDLAGRNFDCRLLVFPMSLILAVVSGKLRNAKYTNLKSLVWFNHS